MIILLPAAVVELINNELAREVYSVSALAIHVNAPPVAHWIFPGFFAFIRRIDFGSKLLNKGYKRLRSIDPGQWRGRKLSNVL